MTPSAKIGGFKVLKDVALISLISPKQEEPFPFRLCRLIAKEKINLPFITAVNDGHSWGMHIMADASNGARTSKLIEQDFGSIFTYTSESAIFSIFPHRSNPTIIGSLLELFEAEGIDTAAYANSPSAVSVVIERGVITKASNAMFGPFSFSTYRTPADWKLAQKGKEQLYKEVVASYQEKRPKVYGLEYWEEQEFFQIKLDSRHIGQVGIALKEFAQHRFYLTFLATSPCEKEVRKKLFVCLPASKGHSHTEIMNRIAPEVEINKISSPVATFSMNGPHFGDRYGIASELFYALKESSVDLLALNCTISSIIGVLPAHQIQIAIQAIQGCFEVPSVTKKDLFSI